MIGGAAPPAGLGRALMGAVLAVACATSAAATAQTLSILPVTVALPARQQAGVITLTNSGQTDLSIQVRAFAWSQSADGTDQLVPTLLLAVSPPLATIPAGHKQIVRLVLRQQAQASEGTYRILVDQIPGPAQVNGVRVTLRSSLPVFAEPQGAAAPHLAFGAELIGGALYLIGRNDGTRHDTVRDLTIRTTDGASFNPTAGTSPYILPGAIRRWLVVSAAARNGDTLEITAATEKSGAIKRTIAVASRP